MEFLLKIVEGSAKGAEIALVGGRRVRVGADDACDIVIADSSLPSFELDVSESGVTFIAADGATQALRPFEVKALGTSAVAIGPAEGAWQPLTWPKAEEPAAGTEPAAAEPGTAAEPAPEAETPPAEERTRSGCGCAAGGLFLVLLAVAAFLAWWFWPQIEARIPERHRFWAKRGGAVSVKAEKKASLAEIAAENGLLFQEKDGVRVLKGNVKRRTERMAIRALALAEDPQTRFDLTDDESLLVSANELLFVVTEGALKAKSASNRVVTVAGYAPSAAKLESAIRALNSDVPGIDRLETAEIQVGGTPPPAVARTKFVAEARKGPAGAPAAVARRDYPIAGVITKPYPCVVMRNGLRLAEGAQIGSATIVRIEADTLTLREGKTEFEWRP